MKKVLLVLFLLSIILSGCIAGRKYTKITPYGRTYGNKIEKTLYIVLKDGVKDSFTIKGAGVKSMDVEDFRKTFKDALHSIFSYNFQKVEFVSETNKDDLKLEIYKVDGRWEKVAVIQSQSATNYEIKIAFKYDLALYNEGKNLKDYSATILGEESSSNIYSIDPVYISAVKALCEDINKKIEIKSLSKTITANQDS